MSDTYFICFARCPNFQNLPPQCRLVPDPNDKCCKKYSCDFSQKITTPAPFFVRTSPATGGGMYSSFVYTPM